MKLALEDEADSPLDVPPQAMPSGSASGDPDEPESQPPSLSNPASTTRVPASRRIAEELRAEYALRPSL